jgi:hypothetical protein
MDCTIPSLTKDILILLHYQNNIEDFCDSHEFALTKSVKHVDLTTDKLSDQVLTSTGYSSSFLS